MTGINDLHHQVMEEHFVREICLVPLEKSIEMPCALK